MSSSQRVQLGIRYFLLTSILVAAVGFAAHLFKMPLLTTTLGPTAYVFVAHPNSETAKFRNAVVGHFVAVLVGLGALYAFGLASRPSLGVTGFPSLVQVVAAALAVGVTLVILEIAGSHHAPAAATTLLISTGFAKPGPQLIGLIIGLGIVLALGPLIGSLPLPKFASSDTVLESPKETL